MATYIEPLAHLLSGNLTYRTDTTALDPNAFTLLAQGQAPDILWIGCADSRIPETTLSAGTRNVEERLRLWEMTIWGGVLNKWLGPVRELRRKNKVELEGLPNDDARAARVAELNVQQSIKVLKQHPAIKRAVVERGLSLHGLIYDIGAGQLKILEEVGGRKMNGH
ncbi:hypothetical protein J4E91_004747 [Alternaria rosae]|nr:hypothetical protein J4E91_004747 [Alternaria rosae]